MPEELFTTTMRKATRKVHAVSDALVNAKLLFALNNDKVWAEGLLIFYEIFKFLEIAMKKKINDNLGQLFIEDMNRTSAFEEDLKFYLGDDWKKNYVVRESVKNYLNHLEELLNSDSDLLMAYVYHLYLGLMSGGQILQKKRELQRKLTNINDNSGQSVTHFNVKISDLKSQLKDKMNAIADKLPNSKKALLIEESKKVFQLNNSIIKTVQGAEKIALKNILSLVSVTVLVVGISYYYIFFV